MLVTKNLIHLQSTKLKQKVTFNLPIFKWDFRFIGISLDLFVMKEKRIFTLRLAINFSFFHNLQIN